MPEFSIDSRAFDAMLEGVVRSAKTVSASVVTTDTDVQKYWPILEGGSPRGGQPWPSAKEKTLYGKGGRVFSKQAPEGFVHIHEDEIIHILGNEAAAVVVAGNAALQAAVNKAADRTLPLLKDSIPVDTGRAKDSLSVEKG